MTAVRTGRNAEIDLEAHTPWPGPRHVDRPGAVRGRSGAGLGDEGDELEQVRAILASVIARNPHLTVSAKVVGDHGPILRKDFRAVAGVIRETATAHDLEVR
ncbi:hypothetical protein [Streptosporangium subroseum]|uniref:hypothetical protein n=1 Tax=Streptosporangium subroseum TaxID=106412 RepID=UPI000B782831|nr:hypothetical protein [Streptosporangium subroseum]